MREGAGRPFNDDQNDDENDDDDDDDDDDEYDEYDEYDECDEYDEYDKYEFNSLDILWILYHFSFHIFYYIISLTWSSNNWSNLGIEKTSYRNCPPSHRNEGNNIYQISRTFQGFRGEKR